MIVAGLDPGTRESAFVLWTGTKICDHQIGLNEDVLAHLKAMIGPREQFVLAIEKIESFGMAVGAETFRTVFWSGRFAQAWTPQRFVEVTRREVKLHLCGHARATDSNIRQALIDRFGPPGVKKAPGLLYGLKGHEYAALAVAVTWLDQHGADVRPGIAAEF